MLAPRVLRNCLTGNCREQLWSKVVPENLDRFLEKARGLGELKNQTLGTEDVTKAYFDTDARLRNAKRMEERLLANAG